MSARSRIHTSVSFSLNICMNKKKKIVRNVLFLCIKGLLFLVLAIYALLNVYGYRFDVTDNTLRRTGVIEIRAFPQNVRVFLDGILKSTSSPYEIQGVDIGEHRLEVTASEFFPWSKEIEVEEQYVARPGTIFLIPLHVESVLTRLFSSFSDKFITDSFIGYYFKDQKRLLIYLKKNNDFVIKEVPFEDSILKVVERDPTHLFILTKRHVYELDVHRLEWKLISLSHPATSLSFDSTTPSFLWYLSDHTVYQKDLMTGAEINLKSGISDFLVASSFFYFCDLDHNMYVSDNTSSFSSSVKTYRLIEEASCPLQQISRMSNHQVVNTGGHLLIDGKDIDEATHLLITTNNTILYYSHDNALYSYDVKRSERSVISRFEEPISGLSPGPSDDHLFVAVGQRLYLCDVLHTYCQLVTELPSVLTSIFYQADYDMLLLEFGSSVNQLSFSFWKK